VLESKRGVAYSPQQIESISHSLQSGGRLLVENVLTKHDKDPDVIVCESFLKSSISQYLKIILVR
jgi:hypothetical protein